MSVLDHLIAAPGVYWGQGHGPGGGQFVARVALVVESERSLTFDYEAWSSQGGLHHAESARMARSGATVVLAATSNGGDDTMLFREGDPGVFGSLGPQRVGLVIGTQEQELTFSWWWTGRDGVLREQSRATLAPMRQVVPAPAIPTTDSEADVTEEPEDDTAEPVDAPADDPADQDVEADALPRGAHAEDEPAPEPPDDPDVEPLDEPLDEPRDEAQHDPDRDREGDREGDPDDEPDPHAGEPTSRGAGEPASTPPTVPWPGILVLNGPSTGIVAQRLAARLTRAAVVRTDLFDRAVRGTAGRPDPALRQRIALSVVQGYAATGHPVILHGASTRDEHEALAAAISRTGLSPVKLVDVAEGEDYGEVARRLIESD
ncbi:MAG TPA: hypothetical protein VHO27_14190 [Angustibacter sp.]|nr:hypothetical protein [Angustibacter sp.]